MKTDLQSHHARKIVNDSMPGNSTGVPGDPAQDDFFSEAELLGFKPEAAERTLKHALAEIREFIREKKWEDAVSIFHPVEEKFPEIVEYDLDVGLREQIGFVLGQLKKFDEAMAQLEICLKKDPDNFHLHSSLAYTAYNSIYAAKNREIFLSGKLREERIRLAHRHFQEAQQLRPDGITNFYRQGMLYKQIEGKTEKALPLFERAVSNWDRLEPAEQEARHQEKKNFIKALYQYSSALLEKGRMKSALEAIKRCLSEDEKTNYISLCFKYYALGKVNFHMGMYNPAKNALLFAMQCDSNRPEDFVCELLAKTYLALDNPNRALEIVKKVPEKFRRPYFRWTEADVWIALENLPRAKKVLVECLDKDARSKHKTLIRLSRINYMLGDFTASLRSAEEAGRFFYEKWGNILDDSLFWQSVNAYRLGDTAKALSHARELKSINSRYPKLRLLLEKLEAS